MKTLETKSCLLLLFLWITLCKVLVMPKEKLGSCPQGTRSVDTATSCSRKRHGSRRDRDQVLWEHGGRRPRGREGAGQGRFHRVERGAEGGRINEVC